AQTRIRTTPKRPHPALRTFRTPSTPSVELRTVSRWPFTWRDSGHGSASKSRKKKPARPISLAWSASC
ncbi:hypothetical protein HK102_010355, partial [Quaeritorhiza haematococci]